MLSCPEGNSHLGTASVSEILRCCELIRIEAHESGFPYSWTSGFEAAAGLAGIVLASARRGYARCRRERCICRKSGGRRRRGCYLIVAGAVVPGIAGFGGCIAFWLGRVSRSHFENIVSRRLSLDR